MNKSWMMLRGESKNHQEIEKTYNEDSDMYCQLFEELCSDGDLTWLNNKENFPPVIEFLNREINGPCKTKYDIITSSPNQIIEYAEQPDMVFARGAFSSYLPILKAWKDSYIIRYSSGKRYMPDPGINYNLILVDTEKQKQEVLSKFPKLRVELFVKSAAKHFHPIECETKYDVCFIAKHGHPFKNIDWVYQTVPKDLSILHLGGRIEDNPPDNVTVKYVDRIDMNKYINQCNVGIVPYENVDSCPRVIPEMLACGLPIICLDTVNIWKEKYLIDFYCPDDEYFNGEYDWGKISNRKVFWNRVREGIEEGKNDHYKRIISSYYKEYLSIPVAAQYLKDLINEEKRV